MTTKKPFRKRHLFPRTLGDVVSLATKPMMDAQGKLFGALIRDWAVMVGEARAKITKPQRLQFPAVEASGAVLHLQVHPAHAPELQYATAQIIEQCARYFGYKAIERIVLHPDYTLMTNENTSQKKPATVSDRLSKEEAQAFFKSMRASIQSADDK